MAESGYAAADPLAPKTPHFAPKAKHVIFLFMAGAPTLAVWGGEFGRTPMVQGGSDGRDHHPNAFTRWMAGGGIKAGARIGETDELGFNVARDKVHVHDLHATMLKLLGFDHTRITFKFQGRNFRLTDVAGEAVEQLIA